MTNERKLKKIKEYDNFILYKDERTGIRTCILKIDIYPLQDQKKKWER